jgi:hypothetical protein
MPSTHKPLPLIASTFWWATLTVSAFIYGMYMTLLIGGSAFDVAILSLSFCLTFAILWFLWSYWQGHDWTRDFVMIGLVLKLGYELFITLHTRHFPHSVRSQVFLYLRIADMLFSAYIFIWLFTKQAKRYFGLPNLDAGLTDQPTRVAR